MNEQLLPLLTEQHFIEGVTGLAVLFFKFPFPLSLCLITVARGALDGDTHHPVLDAVGGIAGILAVFGGILAAAGPPLSDLVSKVLNPELHALATLAEMVQ